MAEFSQALFDTICERIADGESLRAICREDGMPRKASVMRWLAADATLSDQYARAREMQADALFDDCLTIADDTSREPNDRRMSFDARKWMAGKLRPKVYGDKAVIEGPGENGEHLHKVSADDAFATFAAALGSYATRSAGGTDETPDVATDGKT
jgi:hypothetical protein